MGKRSFLDYRGLHVAQVCLLAFCILLCLKSGDAIQCHKCTSPAPNAPCKPNMVCEGSFCTLMKVYAGGALIKYVKECGNAKTKPLCGTDWIDADKRKVLLVCCDTPQCN